MSESAFTPIELGPSFNSNDLTPFEHAMFGSTTGINIGGKERPVNRSLLKELMRDGEARKLVLSPINRGKKSLDQLRKDREKIKLHIAGSFIFNEESVAKLKEKGLGSVLFRCGELDKNRRLTGFEIYFLQNGQRVKLPDDPSKEFVLHDAFAGLVEYEGKKNDAMEFRIKTE